MPDETVNYVPAVIAAAQLLFDQNPYKPMTVTATDSVRNQQGLHEAPIPE
ncbi:MAG TPA: hypothetical protein VFS76_03165 [Pyrinomonadaceae bacterium]|nr:hypothetical protein [Pyrinomonadaceae bacterium]